MKKRLFLIAISLLAVLAVAFPLRGAVTGLMPESQAAPSQLEPPKANSMSELLNYLYDVTIVPLDDPVLLGELWNLPQTTALRVEMGNKGFTFDQADAELMQITIGTPEDPVVVNAMTVSTVLDNPAEELLLSGALTAMVPVDGSEGFFQAHHTNLDPHLADAPDPVIWVNGMPYVYITTLRWVYDRIVYWNYWWYDSGHHPNWYYSYYYWYWRYYNWYGWWPWPYWYWWVDGWYYWHYWYFWSTFFPY
jgi:hypothetical protein